VVGALAFLAAAVFALGLVRDWRLIQNNGQRVTGTVVNETTERFCVRTVVRVRYRFEGDAHVADIPTKGRGFGGLCIHPYFFKHGRPVALMLDPDDPGHVRTVSRWSPLAYNAGGALAFFAGLFVIFATGRWWFQRKRAAARALQEP
jgi:hypothetical protein